MAKIFGIEQELKDRDCSNCIHSKICPVIHTLEQFLKSFTNFWVGIQVPKGTAYVHPIVEDSYKVYAKHCKFFLDKKNHAIPKEAEKEEN